MYGSHTARREMLMEVVSSSGTSANAPALGTGSTAADPTSGHTTSNVRRGARIGDACVLSDGGAIGVAADRSAGTLLAVGATPCVGAMPRVRLDDEQRCVCLD